MARSMQLRAVPSFAATLDDVELLVAGTRVKGAFDCAECGYRLATHRSLRACPACGCDVWERAAWSPFSGRGNELPARLRGRTAAESPAIPSG